MARLSVLLWFACLCCTLITVRSQNFTAVSNADANFQVSIAYDFTLATPAVFSQRCTGAILSDVWVITSASCVCPGGLRTCDDDLNRWRVRFGSSSINTAITLGVARIEIHPQWNGVFPNGYDVALFRLTASVTTLRADMRPLGLPTSVEWSCAGNLGIAGVYTWGSGGLVNQLVLTPAIILTDWVIVTTNLIINQVRAQFDKLFSFTQCQLNPNCVPQGIAVRYTDVNIGLCPTDIGAPLVLTLGNGQRILLGVGSYRFSGNGIQVNPNQPCIENFVNGTVVDGRVPIVFQQIDVVQTWILGLVTNAVQIGSVCGDGLIGYAEQCDDGNLINGDGCSSSCLLEQNWLCTPARARWIREGDNDDDSHFDNWIIQVSAQVDYCAASRCVILAPDDDDDGSSGSIIALVIALPVAIGVALCCLIAWCCYLRHRRRKQKKEEVVEETVIAPAPVPITPVTAPAAPPSTPDVTPVMLEIVSPAYGMGTSEVMPPIIQRENILQAPIIEHTTEVGAPTWIKT